MSLDTSNIIKLFTTNRSKLIALILVLSSISLVAWIKVYYSIDDCKPLVEQNKTLMEQNSMLVNQNTQILQKNQNLLDSYLKIQELLSAISTDTVFITKTEKASVTTPTSYKNIIEPDTIFEDISESTSSRYMRLESPRRVEETQPKKVTSKIRVKTGNKEEVLSEIQKIIDSSKID
jgi:hypothetical protein